MLDRTRALRILGLGESADESEVRAAYRALRGHVTARAEAAQGDARDDAREARREELRDLERAWRALSSLPAPTGIIQPTRPPRALGLAPRWLLAWALLASVLAAGLGLQLVLRGGSVGPRVLVDGPGGGEGDGEGGFALAGDDADADARADAEPGGAAETEDAGPRARLVARARVEGAGLVVRTRDDPPEVVAEGAADETAYWLAPGAYALTVRHPDCPDAWQQDIAVAPDDEVDLVPEVCRDTGWMVVRSNVAGDSLAIDGKPMGATGERKHPVTAGEHEVRVEKPGFRAWEGIVEVEPGQVLGIRPRLEAVEKASAAAAPPPPPAAASRPAQVASARPEPSRTKPDEVDVAWHENARRWLLSRYDFDRSGALDSREEVEAVPCDHWLGLEQSYDQSGLGLPLTRFYGFDGEGWRSGALGVSDEARDLAYERMQACGLR